MDKKIAVAVAAVAAVAVLSFWFYQNRQNSSPTSATPKTAPVGEVVTNSPQATQSATSAQEFTIEGSNFKLSPNQITVKNNTPVKITFKNTGGTHDFVVEGFNVRTPVTQSGQDATVEFTPTQTGTFEYYCSVGTHRLQGMVGTLVVQ